MSWLRQQFREFFGVLADGFTALWRHFPALLAVFLLGYSARMGALWAAGKIATYSITGASLVLPLAPLSLIVSLVVMMRIAARSFPTELAPAIAPSSAAASSAAASTKQAEQAHQAEQAKQPQQAQQAPDSERVGMRESAKSIIVVVLPFLAIYASNGFLKQDMRRYIQDQTGVAWQRLNAGEMTATVFDRVALPATGLLLAVVVVALIMRKLIAWKELGSKTLMWALVAAYLETLWMVSAGLIFNEKVAQAKAWLFSRAGAEDVVYWWNQASGWYGTFIIKPMTTLASLLSPFSTLVVVPVAWLAVGATIYGAKLKKGAPIPGPEAVTKQIDKIPNPVRRTVGHVVEPAVTPVKATVTAIRKIAIAGLVPMILFCLIFVLCGWLRIALRYAFHFALGPRPEGLVYAIEPYAALLDSTVYFLVVICLVAAAVHRVIVSEQAAKAQASTTAPAH